MIALPSAAEALKLLLDRNCACPKPWLRVSTDHGFESLPVRMFALADNNTGLTVWKCTRSEVVQ